VCRNIECIMAVKHGSSQHRSSFTYAIVIKKRPPVLLLWTSLAPELEGTKYRLFWGNEGICDLFTEARSAEMNKHISPRCLKIFIFHIAIFHIAMSR
jgi:hypothetical protein